jgi:tetratricopeptide (TPR) repeat protein
MASGSSPSLLGNAQLALSRAGYYRGPIDGILNPATREAIRNYRTVPYEQFYLDGYPRDYPYLGPAVTERLPDQPVEVLSVTDATPGLAAYRAQDFSLAIEQASAVVRALDAAQPDRMAAFFVRGIAWLQLADNEAAVRDFTSVLRLSPDNAAAYFNRAIAYERAALLELARRDFRRASDLGLPAAPLPRSLVKAQ